MLKRNPKRKPFEEWLQTLHVAIHRGDAKAFAALFAEDADFVVITGKCLKGRNEIVTCRMSPGYQPEGPAYGRAFDRQRNGLSQILLLGRSW
jgi:hypothetical protein